METSDWWVTGVHPAVLDRALRSRGAGHVSMVVGDTLLVRLTGWKLLGQAVILTLGGRIIAERTNDEPKRRDE